MSAAKKIGIAVSDHSVRMYLSAQTVQHLGGPGTRVRFLSKRIAEGHWTVSIREDRQTTFKIAAHASKDHPFKIEMADAPYPLDRWPHTLPAKPVYIPVTYDDLPKRQITFEVRVDELTGKTDTRDLRSALKPLANKIAEEKYVAPAEKLQDTVHRMGVSYDKTDDWERRKDAERQAKPVTNEPLKRIPPDHVVDSATPMPNDQRIRFAEALKAFNGALCHELDDIELFVEQVDGAGGVVKTITLPVPSQMRIRGRIIREETFG